VCKRVETDYRGVADEAERLDAVARVLSEGVFASLKKRGLLAPEGPQASEKGAPEAHGPGGGDSP
jgi:hypothetical protein